MLKKPTESEERIEEAKPTKFNMDLAFQELVHTQLKIAAQAAIAREPIIRFNALKQSRIMIAPAVDKKAYESHLTAQQQIQPRVTYFQRLLYSYSLHFDWDYGNYVPPRIPEDLESRYPAELNKLRDELDLQLDAWEESLRAAMVKIGLFLTKDKTSYDALESD